MNSRRLSETFNGESQQGRWLVYGKVSDKYGHVWLPLGNPSSQGEAEALVETMRAEARVGQPHCVPL